MDNLPTCGVIPPTPDASTTVVAAAGGMKTTIIVASIAAVLIGTGLVTWFTSSSNAPTIATDEQSNTPPSLQQKVSGLKGSFIDTSNNCRGFDATETAAWPDVEAKLKADNTPHMDLVAGLNFGIATKDTKLSEVVKNPTVKCVITAVYDNGKWYLDPDPRGQFGDSTVTITDPTTFTIKAGYGVVLLSQRPGTLYGLVDPKSPLAVAPKFDENAHGWFLTGETINGDFLKSALPRNPIAWIYDPNAPTAKDGVPFSKVADPATEKFNTSFLSWTLLKEKGAVAAVSAGTETSTPTASNPAANSTSVALDTNTATTSTPATTTESAPADTTTIATTETHTAVTEPRPSDTNTTTTTSADADQAARDAAARAAASTSPASDRCPTGTYFTLIAADCIRVPDVTTLTADTDVRNACQLYGDLISGKIDGKMNGETMLQVRALKNNPLCPPELVPVATSDRPVLTTADQAARDQAARDAAARAAAAASTSSTTTATTPRPTTPRETVSTGIAPARTTVDQTARDTTSAARVTSPILKATPDKASTKPKLLILP